jgi:hypothetical protein
MPEFDCTAALTVVTRLGGGSVDLIAEERTTAVVEVTPFDDTEASRQAARTALVEMRGDTLIISAPDTGGAWLWRRSARVHVTARIPAESRVVLKLGSAQASCRGRYATAMTHTASGSVTIDHVTGDLSAHTASGNFAAERVDGAASIHCASGRIRIGPVAGDVNAHSASGDIEIAMVGGSLRAHTASGDVRVDQLRRGSVRVRTASGDVSLGVPAGTGAWLDISTVSGAVRSDLAMTNPPAQPANANLRLQVRTASGDVELRRVEAPEPVTRTAS